MGLSFRRGVELYFRDNPDAPVSFIFDDHKYDGRTTITAMHALRSTSDVRFVVVWGNTPCGAASPVAEQQKIPMLAISMNPDAKDRRFVVSLGFPLSKFVELAAERFTRESVTQHGALVVDLGNTLEAVRLFDQKVGGTVFQKVVAGEEVDFKPIISQFKARRIDGLVLFLLPQQALTFLKQSRQLQFAPHIVGGDVFAVDSFRLKAREMSDKVSFVYGSVVPSFIARLAQSPLGISYFFEAATGYSVAAISAALAKKWQAAPTHEDPLGELRNVSLSGLPLSSVKYLDDSSFGRHLEVAISDYSLDLHASAVR